MYVCMYSKAYQVPGVTQLGHSTQLKTQLDSLISVPVQIDLQLHSCNECFTRTIVHYDDNDKMASRVILYEQLALRPIMAD